MERITGFEIELDDRARDWLTERLAPGRLVLAYEETRCCGGGRVCDVRVRKEQSSERRSLARVGSAGGRDLLVDRRILGRLPRRLPLTVRGLGPFRGLALDLEGEDWARLLYE